MTTTTNPNGDQRMTQIGFSRSEAHEALDQFLDGDREHNGDRMSRWIAEGELNIQGNTDRNHNETAAHIVSEKTWQELSKGYQAWRESEQWEQETSDLPPGYLPFMYSPLADIDGNRCLPTDSLKHVIARCMFRKDYTELEDGDQARVAGAAVLCVLRIQLDPDGRGAVPILAVGHDRDEPGEHMHWQLAFVTDVPGLYLRVSGNGFFGEEWGIVTGSGYRLASGWHSREGAATCAYALGRLLPNADWMRLTPAAYTAEAMTAIGETVRRYGPWTDRDISGRDLPPITTEEPPPAADAQADEDAK
jgi:hypothetical protein